MKPFLIIFIFSAFSLTSLAQVTSSVTASANIVTSVGAENSGEMDFRHFGENNTYGSIPIGIEGVRTINGGSKFPSNEIGAITFINIIGSSFTYDITIQNDPSVMIQKTSMKLNVFKMPGINNGKNTDDTVYPIGASITVGASKFGESYIAKLPFSVTINFN
jgi:hypothetical protein